MDYIDLEGNVIENTTGQDKMLDFLYTNPLGRILLKPLVQPGLSRLSGKFLDSPLSAGLISSFIESNDIDMSDYKKGHYHSFNQFFTRKIIDGKRPIDESYEILISPCDCKATVYKINDNTTFSIKHTEYTLRSLLRSRKLAEKFRGGYLYVLRLTVDDYHRYIYPVTGRQSKNYRIEGSFHTVNPIANDYLPVYKENTREYTVIRTEEFGDIIQMEVGALLVGKIVNHKQSAGVVRGEEKGYFEYGGSTIVLVTQKNAVAPRADLLANTANGYETKVLQGHAIGEALTSPKA